MSKTSFSRVRLVSVQSYNQTNSAYQSENHLNYWDSTQIRHTTIFAQKPPVLVSDRLEMKLILLLQDSASMDYIQPSQPILDTKIVFSYNSVKVNNLFLNVCSTIIFLNTPRR